VLGEMPGGPGTPLSWQRCSMCLGDPAGATEPGHKHRWLDPGLRVPAAAVAGWVSHVPAMSEHPLSGGEMSQGTCQKHLVSPRLAGVPWDAARGALLCCAPGSSRCLNHVVGTAVSRDGGSCPENMLTSPRESRGRVEGPAALGTPWPAPGAVEVSRARPSAPSSARTAGQKGPSHGSMSPSVTPRGICLVTPADVKSPWQQLAPWDESWKRGSGLSTEATSRGFWPPALGTAAGSVLLRAAAVSRTFFASCSSSFAHLLVTRLGTADGTWGPLCCRSLRLWLPGPPCAPCALPTHCRAARRSRGRVPPLSCH